MLNVLSKCFVVSNLSYPDKVGAGMKRIGIVKLFPVGILFNIVHKSR